MELKEKELRKRLDACEREKKELEQTTKKTTAELKEKIRLIESRNLSLKRYSSGLQEERDELQEERDELQRERDKLRERVGKLEDESVGR